MITNKMGWQGIYKIYINSEHKETIKNRVMDNVLDKLAECLRGTSPNLEIKYLAFGGSSTAITGLETKLGSEFFRCAITNQSKTATAEITTEFNILSTEAVGQIEEIGIFGGSTASITANSGTLISRILWSHGKTNAEELNIIRVDRMVIA